MLLLQSSALAVSPWWFLLPLCAAVLIAWNERIPVKAISRLLVALLVAGASAALLSGATTNFLIDCGRRWWAIECW